MRPKSGLLPLFIIGKRISTSPNCQNPKGNNSYKIKRIKRKLSSRIPNISGETKVGSIRILLITTLETSSKIAMKDSPFPPLMPSPRRKKGIKYHLW